MLGFRIVATYHHLLVSGYAATEFTPLCMLTTRAGQMAESEVTLSAFYGISSPWAYLGAERLLAIAKKHGVKLIHRPIRVIQANGGIPLRTRPDSRQQYHEVELDRWRKYLDIPLNLKPKFCRFSSRPGALISI